MSESAADTSSEAIPELLEVGQRLRRAREGRGIGIAELADRLHLAPEQLNALESGDRSHLPEAVFVIAQAKRIAQALGIDISEPIERLRHSSLMQAATAPATPVASAADSDAAGVDGDLPSASRAFPARLAAAIAAIALLLGVGVAQAIRHWSQPRTASGTPAAATDPARPGGGGTTAAPVGAGVLQLRGDEPSWVQVRERNGSVLFSGILEKEARFRLGEGLEVLAGRPDLVTVSIGGEAPRRLGSISEVEWQSFPPSP